MRPFTTDQLQNLAREFTAQQPDPSRSTVQAVTTEFVRYLGQLDPPADPDAADLLFQQGKEAYLKLQDPFRGLSKRAKEIAEKAKREGGHGESWRDTLRSLILSGELFAQRGVGEGTVKELCRLVTAEDDAAFDPKNHTPG